MRPRLWSSSSLSRRSQGSVRPLMRLGGDCVAPFVSEEAAFIERCNPQLLVKTLASLQDGISCWIRDEKTQLNSRQSTAVAESVCQAPRGTNDYLLTSSIDQASLGCNLRRAGKCWSA